MIKVFRLSVAAAALMALVPMTAGGAMASPPNNDVPAGSIHVTLKRTVVENTTKATTGPFDAKVGRWCRAPLTKASVWFRYTAPDDKGFIIDASHSNYTVGLMVFRGVPTGRSIRDCGRTTLPLRSQAGRTYTIMAFSSTATQGGQLRLSIQPAPPAPSLNVSVNPEGQADADGNAHISGTFTCANASALYGESELTQIWERLKISGYVELEYRGMCDGQPHPWNRIVTSENGLYGAGAATVESYSVACGLLTCTDVRATSDVTLTGPGQPSGGTVAPAPRPTLKTVCGASDTRTMWQRSSACTAGRLSIR